MFTFVVVVVVSGEARSQPSLDLKLSVYRERVWGYSAPSYHQARRLEKY